MDQIEKTLPRPLEDYEKRLIAEYKDLVSRIHKLRFMLKKWDNRELDFTPRCSNHDLYRQLEAMEEYRAALENRRDFAELLAKGIV